MPETLPSSHTVPAPAHILLNPKMSRYFPCWPQAAPPSVLLPSLSWGALQADFWGPEQKVFQARRVPRCWMEAPVGPAASCRPYSGKLDSELGVLIFTRLRTKTRTGWQGSVQKHEMFLHK